MLRKFSEFRSYSDNLRLGSITAFSAGMVNVISVIAFFAFTSNVTGHYAILAQEISKGNWYQAAVVLLWVSLFLGGSFVSNLIIIHSSSLLGRYLSHAIPISIEILCLLSVGLYMQHYYTQTLQETEMLVGIMLFAMGIQNGLTASISNFSVKTTHLTGLTTDLGILFSMFTKKKYRNDINLVKRAQLLIIIASMYMLGGVISGYLYINIGYRTFYIVCCVLVGIILYDFYHISLLKLNLRKQNKANSLSQKEIYNIGNS